MERTVLSTKGKRNIVGGALGAGLVKVMETTGSDPWTLFGIALMVGLCMLGANIAHGLEDAAYEASKKK